MIIYLDVDGVLANFVDASIDAHGKTQEISHSDISSWDYCSDWGLSSEEFWSKCAGRLFWRSLRPYPWALDLYAACVEAADEVYFLTAPASTLYSECLAGKADWIATMFGAEAAQKMIPTKHKHLLAGDHTLLIDDSITNVESFVAQKGYALLLSQPWNHSHAKAQDVESIIANLSVACEQIKNKTKVAQRNSEDVLEQAHRLVSGDRNAQYGAPDQDFDRIAGMWTALFADKLQEDCKFETYNVAQAMICLKLSRLQHAKKRDSVIDTAGYTKCMDICFEKAGGYDS